MKKKCIFLLHAAIEDMSDLQRDVWKLCWETGNDRREALRRLGVLGADSATQQREYDQPLCNAKKKLAEALSPYRRFRDNLSYRWLGAVIYDLCRGREPSMQCPEDCEICHGNLHNE